MRLILQTGAHYTEQERLTRTLLRNSAAMSAKKTIMPNPDRYRSFLRNILNAMHRAPLGPDARDVLLDFILEGEQPDRLILSDPNFFRSAGTAVQQGMLYPAAAQRIADMARIFPIDDIEIYLSIRNPAAILPIFKSVAKHPDDPNFWAGRNSSEVRWSETLAEIRELAPGALITVWCNEDMPMIWAQMIREIAGFDVSDKIIGAFDLLTTIMSKEGMQRLRAYLRNNSKMSEIQKLRAISAFLDKFALEQEIEEEVIMPEWTAGVVDELTKIYDKDVLEIRKIPGVRLIAP